MKSARSIRNTINYNQTAYKLEPWGQSSWQLPIIINSTKQRKSALDGKCGKDNNKLSVYYSAEKLKLIKNTRSIDRQNSTFSILNIKRAKNPKFDQNMYRPKSIKNMNLMDDQGVKKVLKKKFSKKISIHHKILNRSPVNSPGHSPTYTPYNESHERTSSKLSVNNQQIYNKIQKRLQIERKIFMMSKDKI